MKTRYYKTIRGFMSANGLKQLSLYQLNNGTIYGSHGWVNFKLSPEAKAAFYTGIASAVWSKVTPERVTRVAKCDAGDHYITNRLIYESRINRFSYCAGQDYEGEIRYIQRCVM